MANILRWLYTLLQYATCSLVKWYPGDIFIFDTLEFESVFAYSFLIFALQIMKVCLKFLSEIELPHYFCINIVIVLVDVFRLYANYVYLPLV